MVQVIPGTSISPGEVEKWVIEGKINRTAWEARMGRKIHHGEIGCALAHFHAWQRCINMNVSFCLILEDDAVINRTSHETWFLSINEYLEAAGLLHNLGIVYIGYNMRVPWMTGDVIPITATERFGGPYDVRWICAHAYVV